MKEVVTYSELRERRRCAYRGHLAYDVGLVRHVKSPGLREGTIADKGMDALYESVKARGEYDTQPMIEAMVAAMAEDTARIEQAGGLFDVEWAEINERYQLLVDVATAYVDFASRTDPFDEIVSVQLTGRVPVLGATGRGSTRYDYKFKADGLVVISGELWLLENKWWKGWDTNALRALQMDEQCGMYLWGTTELIRRRTAPREVLAAADRYGLPVGVYYNVVRKKLPATPAILKDGSTSRDKRIDTTADVYRAALIERGQDPSDYAEVLELLEQKGNTFFHREPIYRNAAELAEIGFRIREGCRLRAEHHVYKFPTRDCTWDCPYWDLCLEWSDELVQTAYRVKPRTHEEYETEVAA